MLHVKTEVAKHGFTGKYSTFRCCVLKKKSQNIILTVNVLSLIRTNTFLRPFYYSEKSISFYFLLSLLFAVYFAVYEVDL